MKIIKSLMEVIKFLIILTLTILVILAICDSIFLHPQVGHRLIITGQIQTIKKVSDDTTEVIFSDFKKIKNLDDIQRHITKKITFVSLKEFTPEFNWRPDSSEIEQMISFEATVMETKLHSPLGRVDLIVKRTKKF